VPCKAHFETRYGQIGCPKVCVNVFSPLIEYGLTVDESRFKEVCVQKDGMLLVTPFESAEKVLHLFEKGELRVFFNFNSLSSSL